MKEALETLEKIGQLRVGTIIEFVVLGFIYCVFKFWRSYLSERARLEIWQQRLQLIMLGFEVENLRGGNPASKLTNASERMLDEVARPLVEPKFWDYTLVWQPWRTWPLKWFLAMRPTYPKWIKPGLLGASGAFFSCLIYMVTILAKLPQGTSADTLKAICFFVFLLTCICVLAATMLCSIIRLQSRFLTFAWGVGLAFIIIPAGAWCFVLFLRIWLLFVNAR